MVHGREGTPKRGPHANQVGGEDGEAHLRPVHAPKGQALAVLLEALQRAMATRLSGSTDSARTREGGTIASAMPRTRTSGTSKRGIRAIDIRDLAIDLRQSGPGFGVHGGDPFDPQIPG